MLVGAWASSAKLNGQRIDIVAASDFDWTLVRAVLLAGRDPANRFGVLNGAAYDAASPSRAAAP